MRETSSGSLTASQATGQNYRWVMFGIYFAGSFCFGFSFQTIPPILPLIIPDLQLSYAQAGSLMSMFSLPGLAIAIPVGLLADRQKGGRKIFMAGLIGLILGGLVVAASTSYPMLLVGRLITGAGGMTTTVMCARTIAQWFSGKDLGLAMGLFAAGFPLATILALTSLGNLASAVGWQAAVLAGPALTIIPLMALLLLYRTSPLSQAILARRRTEKQGMMWRKIVTIGLSSWMVGIIWLWFNASTLSVITFSPDFFNSKGFGLGDAGFLTSIQLFALPVLGPVVGFLLDRYQKPEEFLTVSHLVVALGILAIPFSTSFVIAPLVLMGIAMSLGPVSVLYLASRVARQEDSGLAYGINNACLTVGMAFGPYTAGLVRDATGSYELAFALMAVYAALGGVTAVGLKILRTRSLEG